MESINRLKYMMELLKISGQQLADLLSVDRTLVSKWKNGARPFDPSITHFNNTVDTLIKFNESQGINTLERFFESLISDEEKSKADWVKAALRKWLSGNLEYQEIVSADTLHEELYTTAIDIFHGNQGKRNAIMKILDYAISLPAGQNLLVSDMENMKWLTENSSYMVKWQEKMHEILKKGHHITIIHNTSRDIDSVANIVFNWLPLYFSGNLISYYYQNVDDNISAPSVYVVKDHVAILSMCSSAKCKNRYTAYYKDPFSTAQMERIFRARLSVSSNLVDLYSFTEKNIGALTQRILKLGKKSDDVYLMTPAPVFTTMKRETLIEVLKENKVSHDTIDEIISVHQGIREFFLRDVSKYFCRQFYDLDILREYSDKDGIVYLELSTLAMKPIIVSGAHFKEHMLSLIELIEASENFQVALLPFDSYPTPNKASIWVKQNCFVYAYPQFEGKTLTLSSEPMTIYGFFEKLETIWNKISYINKDRQWVLEQLHKLTK